MSQFRTEAFSSLAISLRLAWGRYQEYGRPLTNEEQEDLTCLLKLIRAWKREQLPGYEELSDIPDGTDCTAHN